MAKNPKAADSRRGRPPTRRPQPRRAKAAPAASSADIEDLAPAVPGAVAAAAAAPAVLRTQLLRWYDAHRRDLPWRRASGGEEERAYAVWVSEVMLQQTRVPVVVGYYERWMARWPTVRSLAAATQEEVNEMWAGLGYYRRARFLLEVSCARNGLMEKGQGRAYRKGAKQIVEKGEFPRTASALREVVPVVDGNVVRVISRLYAISDNPKESSTMKRFWEIAGQLVDPSRSGDFNQAMMELGATLCSKSKPGCSGCPVSSHCQVLALSLENPSVKVTDFPRVVPKAKPRSDFAAVCVVQIAQGLEEEVTDTKGTDNLFLLIKRPEEGLLAGLWEFPLVLVEEGKTDSLNRRKAMDKYLTKLLSIDVGWKSDVILREDVGEHVHIFSHIRLTMYVELMIINLKDGVDRLCKKEDDSTKLKFTNESSVESMGLTSGIRKVYNMVKAFKEKRLSVSEKGQVPTRKRSRRLK
ncbi:A/G-specific adenine DNA glycosylase-like [Panicum miliaceum]|uniref:Adenine DNA glycosylase n=1 Tax=Panicum miliaceum TaxID=4540 RepID=A0A3L6RFB3_PANMI|nr:A/G-specific adenine DNA glycosylase-like [Panicum miliaceum]